MLLFFNHKGLTSISKEQRLYVIHTLMGLCYESKESGFATNIKSQDIKGPTNFFFSILYLFLPINRLLLLF